MKKLYVVLGTPSIEMTVKAKDVSGNSGEIRVGFKRYAPASAQTMLEVLNTIVEKTVYNTSEDREKAIQDFLKGEILYLKNVPVYEEDETGSPTLYKIVEDTRTEKDQELLGEKNSCLDFLLDMLFSSAPWGSAFIETFYAVHMNLRLAADEEIKN